jgi:large subunit ribosomal protein L25
VELSPDLKIPDRTTLRNLRKDKFATVNLYGKGAENRTFAIPLKVAKRVHDSYKKRSVVTVNLESDQSVPVIVKAVQYDKVTLEPIHFDFLKVNLRKKIESDIDVSYINEPEAVKNNIAVLQIVKRTVTVNATPDKTPEVVEFDAEKLVEIGDTVTVNDLIVEKGVEIKDDPEDVVATLTKLVIKEESEEAEEDASEETATEVEGKEKGE